MKNKKNTGRIFSPLFFGLKIFSLFFYAQFTKKCTKFQFFFEDFFQIPIARSEILKIPVCSTPCPWASAPTWDRREQPSGWISILRLFARLSGFRSSFLARCCAPGNFQNPFLAPRDSGESTHKKQKFTYKFFKGHGPFCQRKKEPTGGGAAAYIGATAYRMQTAGAKQLLVISASAVSINVSSVAPF